jgi:hypothetical protein
MTLAENVGKFLEVLNVKALRYSRQALSAPRSDFKNCIVIICDEMKNVNK